MGVLMIWDEETRQLTAVSASNPLPVTGAGGSGPVVVTVNDISDATAIGKAVLKAADAAAVRTAIGAGTSTLSTLPTAEATIGTATTARSITAAVLAGAIAERLPTTPAAVGAAPAAHQHAAADISSGTLDVARIPTLAQSKVTNLSTDLAARIQKSSLTSVTSITDPAAATSEQVATAFNALLAALKA